MVAFFHYYLLFFYPHYFVLGAGKPTVKRIEELSDEYSFIAYALGAQWHD
jgi:hypothetical protein